MRSNPNHGSNYEARRSRTERRYLELLQDATYRSWAIADGLQLVYGKDLPPPQPSDEFLDDLVHWHKIVLDEREQTLRRDTEYALLLSLQHVQKDGTTVQGPNSSGGGPLTDAWTADRKTLKGNSIRFRLDKNAFFLDQDCIRLRGIGLAIEPPQLGAWSVKVSPPGNDSDRWNRNVSGRHTRRLLRTSALKEGSRSGRGGDELLQFGSVFG